jgi:hypothetical protein
VERRRPPSGPIAHATHERASLEALERLNLSRRLAPLGGVGVDLVDVAAMSPRSSTATGSAMPAISITIGVGVDLADVAGHVAEVVDADRLSDAGVDLAGIARAHRALPSDRWRIEHSGYTLHGSLQS